MTLRLFNTLTGQAEEFVPIVPGHVRMYVCGMTIYDLCHMGHARMMMAFDVVYRWLRASGYQVTYVRNITDIDDKIIKRAVERGITIRQLTDEMIAAMRQDIGQLGIEPPTHEPRATDYVAEMLDLIGTLESRGLAYRSPNGDVNYAVRKFPEYGQLSKKSIDDLRAGERVAVNDGKADPLDFVLWKAAKPEEPEDAKWESTYGAGRPGWHIECSAMSCKLLGTHFDIHGGGMDLQFPHHENEIAQSRGAGFQFADKWLHNGFLNVDGEKMSKSLGNFFTIRDVLKDYRGETLRFFMLRTHYRSPFNFADSLLDESETALTRFYTALDAGDAALAARQEGGAARRVETLGQLRARLGDVASERTPARSMAGIALDQFVEQMDIDFNVPGALGGMFTLASDIGTLKNALDKNVPGADHLVEQLEHDVVTLRSLGAVLGILQADPRSWLQAGAALGDAEIQVRIAARAQAKKERRFAEADRIRRELADLGIALKDGPDGTTWVKA
jgi:cysteinyl-tRNA synthetase